MTKTHLRVWIIHTITKHQCLCGLQANLLSDWQQNGNILWLFKRQKFYFITYIKKPYWFSEVKNWISVRFSFVSFSYQIKPVQGNHSISEKALWHVSGRYLVPGTYISIHHILFCWFHRFPVCQPAPFIHEAFDLQRRREQIRNGQDRDKVVRLLLSERDTTITLLCERVNAYYARVNSIG